MMAQAPVRRDAPPSGARWAAGIALAFGAGLAWALTAVFGSALNSVIAMSGLVPLVLAFVVMGALAVAAAFVMRTWQAALPLAVATTAGTLVATWWGNQGSPAGMDGEGLGWFLVKALASLVVVVIATAIAAHRAE